MTAGINSESGELEFKGFPAFFIGKITHFINLRGVRGMKREKITLSFEEMPKSWYNIKAELPFKIDPMLNPGTGEPIKPEELAMLFPPSLVEQEFNCEDRLIPIPEELIKEYYVYRPSPLVQE
jgi:hypothetical protein